MNYLFKRLLIIGLFLAPTTLFAQLTGPTDTTGIFALDTTNDPSYLFLAQLFGTVGPVLHGTSGIFLGTLFQYFNLGILVVAGIFLLWTTVKIIIHSSHEGSFMGKESKAGFNIMRTVLGIGLLTPSVGGYSVIQMFVMWSVLQGCGFANTVWAQALQYLKQGQIFVSPTTQLSPLIAMAGTALQAEVCMQYSQKLENDLQADAKLQIAAGNTAPNYTKNAANFPSFVPYYDMARMVVNFPSSRGNDPTDAGCGSISWQQAGRPQWNSTVHGALQQVIANVRPAAIRIVSPYPGDLTPFTATNTVGVTTTSTPLQNLTMQALVYAAQDWANLLTVIRAASSSPAVTDGFFEDALAGGWLYAGSYYYQLSSVQRTISATVNISFTLNSPPACMPPTNGSYLPVSGSSPALLTTCIDQKADYYANSLSMPSFDTKYTMAANYINAATTLAVQTQSATGAIQIPPMSAPNLGPMGAIGGPAIGGFSGALSNLGSGSDPIMELQATGEGFINTVVTVWLVVSFVMFGLGLVTNMCQSIMPIGQAIRDGLNIFLPILLALLGMMFIEGMILAVYVPMIPMIIFTFTVLGWFIAVLEAMIAAPLVALGVTHPEGHDFLGQSQQAVMLLMGVFLRPVLMIIGLMAGMLLAKIGLTIFNNAFAMVLTGAHINAGMMIGMFTGITFIYSVLVMQVVTQCYSLVFAVPDRVLRWLGQSPEQTSGATQALQAAESKQKEMGQAGAEGMKSGMTAAVNSGGKGGGEGGEGGGKTGGSGS